MLYFNNNKAVNSVCKYVIGALINCRLFTSSPPPPLPIQCNLPSSNNGLRGKLLTREGLDAYERFWHQSVFTPSWSNLKVKVTDYSVCLPCHILYLSVPRYVLPVHPKIFLYCTVFGDKSFFETERCQEHNVSFSGSLNIM